MMTHEEKCKKILFNAIDEHFKGITDRLKARIQEDIEDYHKDLSDTTKSSRETGTDYFKHCNVGDAYCRFSGYGSTRQDADNVDKIMETSMTIVVHQDSVEDKYLLQEAKE